MHGADRDAGTLQHGRDTVPSDVSCRTLQLLCRLPALPIALWCGCLRHGREAKPWQSLPNRTRAGVVVTHTHTHTHTHTPMHTCMYTHTHTHTHTINQTKTLTHRPFPRFASFWRVVVSLDQADEQTTHHHGRADDQPLSSKGISPCHAHASSMTHVWHGAQAERTRRTSPFSHIPFQPSREDRI